MPNSDDRHIISAEVENRPGVLARVVSLFSARGFNIESLNVGETNDPRRSRITIAVSGDDQILEQIRKQLEKLIDTHKVVELSQASCVERDLALVKVKVPAARRGEMRDLADIFRARIADVTDRHMIVEVSGSEDKIQAFLRLAAPFGVAEMARSGRIAIKRGD
ncbi:MAG: acetolactate synthase small subunit [Planctomycetota bacterium]|jgi:acetolactate synthase-1/3 small subunit|nr:acetolactate synthase small subunit [Planctomycetota bacterium]